MVTEPSPTRRRSARRSAAAAVLPKLALLLAVVALTLGEPRAGAAGEPSYGYRFGVFPYLPVLSIDQIFGPMASRFAEQLGRPVYLKTKSTFEKFADELARQTYDIVLVHPFFYVEAADKHDYRPLARVDQELRAVVIVSEDRPWRAWRDLAGRTLALPPELSAVSALVRAELVEAGLRPEVDVALRHYGTKMACVQAAVSGSADACAMPDFLVAKIEAMAGMKLRAMVRTRPISHFVIAVHSRVPAADRVRLLQDILAWPRTEDGQAILAAGAWPRFVAADDAEYDDVRRQRSHRRSLAQR